jgi:hypothetical protein
VAVSAVLLWAAASGRTERQVLFVYCISRLKRFHLLFLPCQTRLTWAYPARYTPALASSAIPMLRLLPRLAVGVATTRGAQNDSVSMFCIRYGRS